jgi:hypothetical protein
MRWLNVSNRLNDVSAARADSWSRKDANTISNTAVLAGAPGIVIHIGAGLRGRAGVCRSLYRASGLTSAKLREGVPVGVLSQSLAQAKDAARFAELGLAVDRSARDLSVALLAEVLRRA